MDTITKLTTHLKSCCEYIVRVYETDRADYSIDLNTNIVTFYKRDSFSFDIDYFELPTGKLDSEASKHLAKRENIILD